MKRCPKCRLAFEVHILGDNRRCPDEIMRELLRLQETSDLCLDCLLEDWVAKIGAAKLKQRYSVPATAHGKHSQPYYRPGIL